MGLENEGQGLSGITQNRPQPCLCSCSIEFHLLLCRDLLAFTEENFHGHKFSFLHMITNW